MNNMFGLGFSEVLTLGIVIIVLLNPKDLPKIMHKLGSLYARIMREFNGAKKTYHEFEKEITDIDLEDK
jgi:sec-independent protein translocase protein TatB